MVLIYVVLSYLLFDFSRAMVCLNRDPPRRAQATAEVKAQLAQQLAGARALAADGTGPPTTAPSFTVSSAPVSLRYGEALQVS